MAERQAARPGDKQTFDAKANRVVIQPKSGARFEFFLNNARRDFCKAEAADRYDVLLSYVAASTTVSESIASPANADNLMPAVRARSYFATLDLQSILDGRTPGDFESVQSLGSDIVVQIARDSETMLAYLTTDGIAKTKMSPPQALQAALTNLRKRSSAHWLEVGSGLYVSNWHDSYDASRLLLTDMIRQLSLKGDPVAMAPDPDTLLVTGSADIPNLLQMSKLAKKYLQDATRPLSGQAIILQGDQWVDFIPEDRKLQPLVNVQRERLYVDYDQQQSMLQRHVGDDIFVAKYDLLDHEKLGGLRSYATWPESVHTLLPRTDLVGFIKDDSDDMMLVPWAIAQQIVGKRMSPTDWYPPRYEVTSFPTTDELAALKRHDLMKE